jgi:hypothetical protein
MTVMSRQALFEAAWERPLTDVAADIGITSTGLKKICDRHDIPTPGRGYWAQVRAGRTFPRPKLRPAKTAALEQVGIVGARPLPAAVKAVLLQAKEASPKRRRSRRAPVVQSAPDTPVPAADPMATDSHEGDLAAPSRKDLEATRRAIARARLDGDGFGSASGQGVISLRTSPAAQQAALAFLAQLLETAEARGWMLRAGPEGAKLVVDGEPIAFRLEEQPTKAPHEPTAKELAAKKECDHWGGDSRPWRTWDLSPSGRLALVIEENDYSGLRRTYSERKGFAFVGSLDVVLTGFAAHAALKVERRREDAARAKAAAEAEARRQRLEAFSRREQRRGEFVDGVASALSERAKHAAILSHLEAAPNAARTKMTSMEAWLRRRILALDALVDPVALEISARHAEVRFEEPPLKEDTSRWYAPKVELYRWIPAEEEGRVRGVDELEWAVAKGLIRDPREAEDPSPETSEPLADD